ncbi:MAG: hypothetical protein ACSHXH_19235 [Marivita sp.]
MQAQYPAFDWDQDRVIIWLSAWFTIVLIPVVGVWVFANRLARILVTLMALAALPTIYRFAALLLGDYPPMWQAMAWAGLAQNGAIIAAVMLLFLPPSSRWLHKDKEISPETFD